MFTKSMKSLTGIPSHISSKSLLTKIMRTKEYDLHLRVMKSVDVKSMILYTELTIHTTQQTNRRHKHGDRKINQFSS